MSFPLCKMQEVATTTTTFGNSTFVNGLCLCSQCFWSRYFEEQAGFSWKVEWFVLMFVKLKSSIHTFWKGGHEEAERDRERRPSVRGEVGAVWSARAARAERQCFDHAWRGTEKVGGRSSIVTFVQHVLAHNCFYRGATRIYILHYIMCILSPNLISLGKLPWFWGLVPWFYSQNLAVELFWLSLDCLDQWKVRNCVNRLNVLDTQWLHDKARSRLKLPAFADLL